MPAANFSYPWIVELEVVEDLRPARWVTLIVDGYDGSMEGARRAALDVFDYCEIRRFGEVRPLRGELVDARDEVEPSTSAPAVDEAEVERLTAAALEGREPGSVSELEYGAVADEIRERLASRGVVVSAAERCAVCGGDLDDHWVGSCPDVSVTVTAEVALALLDVVGGEHGGDLPAAVTAAVVEIAGNGPELYLGRAEEVSAERRNLSQGWGS